jgi:hypothetical protein
VEIEGEFNAGAVFQLLAKIAHGMMIVDYEMDHIKALLPDIILDTNNLPNAWLYIGAAMPLIVPRENPPPGLGMHQIVTAGAQMKDGRLFVVVDICLFPEFPTYQLPVPTYRIVAGESDRPLVRRPRRATGL